MGIGIVDDHMGNLIQRPLLMGFGEKLAFSWLQIDPHQTVWGTWILIPPFGAPIDVAASSVQQSGGNSDFHATVKSDPNLQNGITNVDFDLVTRGLGQLTFDDTNGVHLSWTAVDGARSYRIYRSQDRYSFDREHSFLVEVPASQLSYWDTSTTGTPGEPEAYFYAIETVFGPEHAAVPEGVSRCTAPCDSRSSTRTGLFGRTLFSPGDIVAHLDGVDHCARRDGLQLERGGERAAARDPERVAARRRRVPRDCHGHRPGLLPAHGVRPRRVLRSRPMGPCVRTAHRIADRPARRRSDAVVRPALRPPARHRAHLARRLSCAAR